MNIAQCVCSSLMDTCKLHAVQRVNVLCTRIRSDNLNGSEHSMQFGSVYQLTLFIQFWEYLPVGLAIFVMWMEHFSVGSLANLDSTWLSINYCQNLVDLIAQSLMV